MKKNNDIFNNNIINILGDGNCFYCAFLKYIQHNITNNNIIKNYNLIEDIINQNDCNFKRFRTILVKQLKDYVNNNLKILIDISLIQETENDFIVSYEPDISKRTTPENPFIAISFNDFIQRIEGYPPYSNEYAENNIINFISFLFNVIIIIDNKNDNKIHIIYKDILQNKDSKDIPIIYLQRVNNNHYNTYDMNKINK